MPELGQSAPGLVRIDPSLAWLETMHEFDVRVFGVDAWALRAWKDALSGSWADFVLYISPRSACEAEQEAQPRVVVYDSHWQGDPSGWCVVGVGGVSRGEQADILTIALAEHLRGEGLGAVLLADLMSLGVAHGAREFFLEVRAKHTRVQEFYRHHGFEAIGMRKRYYHDDDAMVMHRMA